MGIVLEKTAHAGCYEVRIVGLALMGDHAALFAHVDEMIRSGEMRALLIDAREAELPQRQSVSREIWDDGLAVLRVIPLGYMPPPNETEARQAMIRDAVEEWEADLTVLSSHEEALDWYRRQTRTQDG